MSFNDDSLAKLTKKELIEKMKSALQDRESLEYLVESLHGISWEFDLTANKFIYVSANAKEVLGYETEEWIDINSWVSMIHEDDKKVAFEYCTTETGSGKNHAIEYRMRKKNGETIWVLDLVTLKKDENNQAVALYGFILDITKQKETQLKLEKEHKFLQTVINGICDPVMIINSDYSVDIMNRSVQKTLKGRTFMDPSSPKCYEISHHRTSPCEGVDIPCPLKEVLESGKDSKVVHKHKCRDGSNQYVELAASPLFDESNKCTGIIESARDITQYIKLSNELKKQVELTEYKATHDYLTGLPNRALFMDRLEQAIKDTKRTQANLALFFIDLDFFKEVNDTYGHDIGDKVLQEVCKKFKSQTREYDILSRLGGDEFTIIMKDFANTEDIATFAEKFVNIFNERIVIDGIFLKLSVSIGISVYHGGDESGDRLLQHADTAMYRAKANGKNSFEFFEEYIFNDMGMKISSEYL